MPLVVRTRQAHSAVRRWWAGRDLALSGHAPAAMEHGSELATRDTRAKATYEAVGASVIVVG